MTGMYVDQAGSGVRWDLMWDAACYYAPVAALLLVVLVVAAVVLARR